MWHCMAPKSFGPVKAKTVATIGVACFTASLYEPCFSTIDSRINQCHRNTVNQSSPYWSKHLAPVTSTQDRQPGVTPSASPLAPAGRGKPDMPSTISARPRCCGLERNLASYSSCQPTPTILDSKMLGSSEALQGHPVHKNPIKPWNAFVL